MIRSSAKLLAASALAGGLFLSGCQTVTDVFVPPSHHSQVARDLGMPTATPGSLGFTDAGLDALNAEFRALVDQKKLAGVTTLVARHGKVVHFDTYGAANAATGEALKPDSIFRIASMTKPIAGVAMMQLWEQGKWQLSDPVSKYIPEFANLQVKGPNGSLVPQARPMTMAQLMSHSAGFGVSAVYEKDGLGATDLQGMIDKLAKLPLETQPGTNWDYGPSVNIQGYIVEKLSGQSLDVYFDEHIFKPLGMVDTGFWAPGDKAARVVAIHSYENGVIKGPAENRVTSEKPSIPCRLGRADVHGGRLLALCAGDRQWWRAGWQAHPQGRHREADAHQRAGADGESGPLWPEPGRHRLRHGLRDRDGPAEGWHPAGPQHILLGRRLRHMVLDRSDQ